MCDELVSVFPLCELWCVMRLLVCDEFVSVVLRLLGVWWSLLVGG